MNPALQPGHWVYCKFDGQQDLPPGVNALATYRESEGVSAIVEHSDAVAHGLAHHFDCALITLSVHSDLASVGFMSEILKTLAARAIPCNVVSAYYHDHLFVPLQLAQPALDALHMMKQQRVADIARCPAA
jgi:hypothetical protein